MDTDGIMTSDRSMEKNPQVHATRNKTQKHASVSAVILLGDRAMRPCLRLPKLFVLQVLFLRAPFPAKLGAQTPNVDCD
ncbi:hypothetical protein NC651_030179 [Populus alba x Populus x berolinensis]|nr:hypothetical protein NC651_030179 [Populus alba x Populus x berolinensis]